MDSFLQEVGKRCVDRALPRQSIHAGEGGRDDVHGEMAFAAWIVAGMAAMFLAVVNDSQMRRSERLGQTFGDFGGDGAA